MSRTTSPASSAALQLRNNPSLALLSSSSHWIRLGGNKYSSAQLPPKVHDWHAKRRRSFSSQLLVSTEQDDKSPTNSLSSSSSPPLTALSYEEYKERLEALAFLSSIDADAASRAETLFDNLLKDASIRPSPFVDVTLWNLFIECRAHSNPKTNRRGALRAEQILARMETSGGKGTAKDDVTPLPNTQSYIKVMDGYANRHKPMEAQRIFDKLQQHCRERTHVDDDDDNDDNDNYNGGNKSLQLTTEAYNALIRAWFKSSSGGEMKRLAPLKAEKLLREMLDQYINEGKNEVKPNKETYILVMNCYAASQMGGDDKTSCVANVQRLIQEMEDLHERNIIEDIKPDTQAYNALIKALGQQEQQQGRGSNKRKVAASQAESILYQLIESYKQDGDVTLRPNAATFINVINAWKNTGDKLSGTKAEKLLELQEGMYELEPNADDLKPDVRVYNAVMNAIARSKDKNHQKAERAKRVLDKMKHMYESRGGKDQDLAPNVRSYNTVLNACAYTSATTTTTTTTQTNRKNSNSKEDIMKVFRIAVETFNELRDSSTLEANHVTYGTFLLACANLMPPNEKREAVVENIFRKCCKDGWVSSYVLESLSKAASKGLCRKLLGGEIVDGVDIPVEWSRNVDKDEV